MNIKKIDKIFNDFYENNPLRFGIRKEEVYKHFDLPYEELLNIIKQYNEKYGFNGIVFYKKNREIFLNEKLENLKNELLKYFVNINKLDLDYFEINFHINKKAILHTIHYLVDIGQLVELVKNTYYLKSQIFHKYLNIITNELRIAPRETSYLKDKLELSREKTIIFLEYLDYINITKFSNNKRYLINLPDNFIQFRH